MRPLKKISGFTLIEMAVVILVTGLIIASTTSYYGLYLKRENEKITNTNIKAVTDQVSAFRNINGRYPGPASLTLPRGNPDYGRENTTVCRNAAKAPGTCENGICIKSTSRDVDPALPGNETVRVCVGTIPFRQLNLNEEYAFDAYGGRLLYAVTENLTDDALFKADRGGIEVLKAQSNVSAFSAAEQGSAHFVILSHGANRAGSFTAEGTQLPCPATGAENTNCNNGPAATFRVAQTDMSNDNTAFDDKINYYIREPIPLWQISSDPTANAQGDMILKPTGNLGTKIDSANNSNPLPSKTFVNGIMRASKSLEGQRICDQNGANCFYASMLAGPVAAPDDNSGLKCPEDDNTGGTGTYMVGIANGEPICQNVVSASCPAGKIMTGIAADGTIKCASIPPPCTPGPATKQDPCPSGGPGYLLMQCTKSCPSGAMTGCTLLADYCSTPPPPGCNPASYQQYYKACPQGYKPNPNGILMRRYKICPANTWGPYNFVSSDCVPGKQSSCVWTASGTPQTSTSGKIGKKAGSPCSKCGKTGPCYTGSGPWSNYSSCSCSGS